MGIKLLYGVYEQNNKKQWPHWSTWINIAPQELIKSVAFESCCISKIMLPVKRCRQQVCLGKRCQRQPSANHICVSTRLIDT